MSDNYVIITTLSHFKLKYAIPQKDFDSLGFTEPLDREELVQLVSSGRVKEFSQNHLGEVLGDVSVYTEEDALTIFDIDNAYLKDWSKEKKLSYIQNWDEDATQAKIESRLSSAAGEL
jgi:hypothetical protein